MKEGARTTCFLLLYHSHSPAFLFLFCLSFSFECVLVRFTSFLPSIAFLSLSPLRCFLLLSSWVGRDEQRQKWGARLRKEDRVLSSTQLLNFIVHLPFSFFFSFRFLLHDQPTHEQSRSIRRLLLWSCVFPSFVYSRLLSSIFVSSTHS